METVQRVNQLVDIETWTATTSVDTETRCEPLQTLIRSQMQLERNWNNQAYRI